MAIKDLKTLEAFSRVNPQSVPRGVGGVEVGEFGVLEMCQEIASPRFRPISGDLYEASSYVLIYLGEAYRAYGNEDISWKDAWWRHADKFGRLLQCAMRNREKPDQEGVFPIAFASAGLPLPMTAKIGST